MKKQNQLDRTKPLKHFIALDIIKGGNTGDAGSNNGGNAEPTNTGTNK